jgi:hypothetical protein
VKTSNATACSLPGIPVCAIAAIPATSKIRFLGLIAAGTTPVPRLLAGVKESKA